MPQKWEDNFREYLHSGLDSIKATADQVPSCIARMDSLLANTYFKTTTGIGINTKECERSFNLIKNVCISIMRFQGLSESEALGVCYELGRKKNASYGHNNILKFGILGIVVRVGDKIERLKALIEKDPQFTGESFADALVDTANYCAYAEMLCNSVWD